LPASAAADETSSLSLAWHGGRHGFWFVILTAREAWAHYSERPLELDAAATICRIVAAAPSP
jgi:hypothetical protein